MARSKEGAAGARLLLAAAAALAACCLCHGLQLSEQEKKCVDQYRILYPEDNVCYKLGNKGPCEDGELLFLDDSEADEGEQVKPTPVCKQCRCCHRGTTAVYWNATGECLLRISEGPRVCPHAGTELREDAFGLGECACLPGHVRPTAPAAAASGGASSGGWGVPLYLTTAPPPPDDSGRCWPLFRRGPCARGQVLLPGGDCGADECRRENAGGGGATFVPLFGRCRRLGDPCPRAGVPPNSTVGISSYTGNPTCVDRDTNPLNLVDAPANCPTAAGGEGCEKVVNVPKDGDDYYQKLLEAAEKRRRKRRVRPNALA
ncbi:uncharacterized protein LOC124544683 [Schistocerca americana]|uniref:uncharacterized protein LOC124544683 n=1 Tax=Schistocerca americana TaxID=7009 RepID=UPI001F502DA9|nr:uncharacterized protein LOC124544683 [Schistocerca americana]